MDNTTIRGNISTISYNSTGWSSFKISFLQTLLATHCIQVCAVQEHMLLKRNINRISNAFPDYDTFILPAIKSNGNISSGRPSSGLVLIFRKTLSKYVTHINCPDSSRVHAIKVSMTNETFVFINVYLPTDPRTHNFDDTLLLKSLQDIQYRIRPFFVWFNDISL